MSATSASALLSAFSLLVACPRRIAHAADAPTTVINLEVLATPDCTTQADLTARVFSRLPRIQFGATADALLAKARFSALSTGNIEGELTLSKAGAKPSVRRLVARSCAQAADAVALIIAVTVDPTSASAKDAPEAAGKNADDGSKASQKPAPRATTEARAPAPNLPVARPTPDRRDDSAAPGTSSSAAPRFGAHVSGQALFGVAPTFMTGVALDAMVAFDRDAPWSPAVVLGISHAFRTNLAEQGGTAAFMLDAASLDACALRLSFMAFETRACATALMGRLSATGSDTQNAPDTVHRPFAMVGVSALASGRVHPLVEVWGRAALGPNLVRDSFEFAPFLFHTVEPVTFSASLGIGLCSR